MKIFMRRFLPSFLSTRLLIAPALGLLFHSCAIQSDIKNCACRCSVFSAPRGQPWRKRVKTHICIAIYVRTRETERDSCHSHVYEMYTTSGMQILLKGRLIIPWDGHTLRQQSCFEIPGCFNNTRSELIPLHQSSLMHRQFQKAFQLVTCIFPCSLKASVRHAVRRRRLWLVSL